MIYIGLIYGLIMLSYTMYKNINDIHNFQQNLYRSDRYWRWLSSKHHRFFKDSDFSLLVSGVSVVVSILAPGIWLKAAFILVAVLSLAFSRFVYRFWLGYHKTKLKLNYTFRVKRLLTTTVIITIALSTAPFILSLINNDVRFTIIGIISSVALNMFSFVSVMLAGAVNQPIENKISSSFVNDAKRILRMNKNLIIVGVTGSYGKTSVKNILGKMLSEKYSVLVTPESYNTTMGVVRTIREKLKPYHEVFVVEMGAHEPGDIKEICDLVEPDFSLITSIGEQHLESFKTLENVISTKGEIFDGTKAGGTVFINLADEHISKISLRENVEKVTYLEHFKPEVLEHGHMEYEINDSLVASMQKLPDPFITPSKVQVAETGTRVTLKMKSEDGSYREFDVTTKLLGRHNIENIVACASVALKLGVSPEQINKALFDVNPVKHRLSYYKNSLGYTILDDAFNSNPIGSRNALEALSLFDGNKKFVITPGMIELGPRQYEYNKRFGKYMVGQVDFAVLVGEKQTKPIFEGLKENGFNMDNVYVARNITDGFEKINSMIKPGDVLLIENDLPDIFNEK